MAKRDKEGNLVISSTQLKILHMQEYKDRLRHRRMGDEYINIMVMKESLWNRRLQRLKRIKSSPWTMKELDRALMSLKNNQSRDPLGMISELFKPKVVGVKIKIAILKLMNGIKTDQ